MTFLPKYFEDLGNSPATYGLMTGIFVFGGALGTFYGGWLGDRFNRRLVIFGTLLLAIPFCYLLLETASTVVIPAGVGGWAALRAALASGWSFVLCAALAGAFLNASHSILIVMAQALLPQQKGMMGGATLGFMFASGAIMAWVAGVVADAVGLSTVLHALSFLPLAAGFTALLLPSTRPATATRVAVPTPSAGD